MIGYSFDGSEIQKNRKAQIAKSFSIGKTLSKSKEPIAMTDAIYFEELEKGQISDSLSYGYGQANEAIKFDKTGAQIKEMLPSCVSKLEATKNVVEAQMAAAIATVGVAPTVDWNGTNCSVKRYPYDLINNPYDQMTQSYPPQTEVQAAADLYNSLCYTLQNICDDLATCKVMTTNLDDKKKYSLSVSQLVALNFNDCQVDKGSEDELQKSEAYIELLGEEQEG